jgi:SAM-dependent methyltransferase
MSRSLEQRRPRLLAHLGRWGRARRWLPADARRVMDVGCATGYGTAALASGQPRGRWVAGLEHDTVLARDAGRRYPWVPLVCGDAAALPVLGGALDAVTLLDVLEHLPDPKKALEEVRRVLRPGGWLILSAPHAGLLARLDANNIYFAMRRTWPSLAPLEAYDDARAGVHRHFAVDELRAQLEPRFEIDRLTRTGLGIAELFHLLVMILFRVVVRWPDMYLLLRYMLHFNTYLLEDCFPSGTIGYHVTLRARAV